MALTSLDPRINRLQLPDYDPNMPPKPALDQFETFEVFHQKKEKAPFTYVGPVHAPNEEVAFLFAKEQHSRRSTCTGIWVARTRHILVSLYTDELTPVYEVLEKPRQPGQGPEEAFEIFELKKRGKAHTHAGTVRAGSPEEALWRAKEAFAKPACVNIWVVRAQDLLRTGEEDKDLWRSTAEKKYREAADYRVMDKINKFKAENQS
jgi:ring-1,2-phenylacetyl-CoA epoxidase subunit PaaB